MKKLLIQTPLFHVWNCFLAVNIHVLKKDFAKGCLRKSQSHFYNKILVGVTVTVLVNPLFSNTVLLGCGCVYDILLLWHRNNTCMLGNTVSFACSLYTYCGPKSQCLYTAINLKVYKSILSARAGTFTWFPVIKFSFQFLVLACFCGSHSK